MARKESSKTLWITLSILIIICVGFIIFIINKSSVPPSSTATLEDNGNSIRVFH